MRADSTSLMIFRHYIVEVFMRRTASTSLRSLSVSLPFRALPTDTNPRSRWRLPWSLDSTMYCRPLRTLNAQRCTVGPHLAEDAALGVLRQESQDALLPSAPLGDGVRQSLEQKVGLSPADSAFREQTDKDQRSLQPVPS